MQRRWARAALCLVGLAAGAAEPAAAQCSALSGRYEWGPFHQGRHNRIRFTADLEPLASPRTIADFLAVADIAYERFGELFGWEFVPGEAALDHYVQPDLGGAGTGPAGTCWGPGYFALPFREGDFGGEGQHADRAWFPTLVHEHNHLWDFRSQYFLQGPDTAHSLTVGTEPWLSAELGAYYAPTWAYATAPLPPDLARKRSFRSVSARYLGDAGLDWSSYFSDAAFAEIDAGVLRHPEGFERLGIQGGLLLAIQRMHGNAGLRGVFDQLEAWRLALGDDSWTQAQLWSRETRNETLLRALSRGLGLDATDYFDHWKYPVPAALRAELASLPKSAMIVDGDADGFSPLEGDLDDADAAVYPGAPELADGLDNNLDGLVDELVVDEAVAGDLPDAALGPTVALPLLVRGELTSLADADLLRVELPDPAVLTVLILPLGGPTDLIDGQYFSGPSGFYVSVGDVYFGTAELHLNAGISHYTALVGAGTHDVRIATNPGHPYAHPGAYEVQVFANDFRPGDLVRGDLRYRHKVYSGLAPAPAFSCASANDVTPAECEVLLAIYRDYGGESWRDPSGWLATPDVCYWRGVRCGADGVVHLDLRAVHGLAGPPLGSAIFQFPALRELRIADTATAPGPLPDLLALLPALRALEAYGAHLTGPPPASLASLPELRTLHLGWNELDGPLPAAWAGLAKLRSLDVQGNRFSGPIPPSFVDLPLRRFRFDGNDLCVPDDDVLTWLGRIPDVTPGPYRRCNAASCVDDAACEDGVPCTTDACDGTLGECVVSLGGGSCDDGDPCDGTEYCDAALGCREGELTECLAACGCFPGCGSLLRAPEIRVKLDFRKPDRDQWSAHLVLDEGTLPPDFAPAGQEVAVDLGGSPLRGVLDARGRFKEEHASLKLKRLRRSGLWKLQAKRSRGAFAADFADEGLLDETVSGKFVDVALNVTLGDVCYEQTQTVFYRAQAGRKGTAIR